MTAFLPSSYGKLTQLRLGYIPALLFISLLVLALMLRT